MLFFIVFLGGMIGAALRFLVTVLVPAGFTLFLVNGLGSLAMGMLQGFFHHHPNSKWKLFLTTGILGAFTTFSSFSGEWLAIMEHSQIMGILYALLMTALCVTLASFGYLLMKKKVEL